MGSQGVVETFRDFERSTKILVWTSLGLGLALFAGCLTADLRSAPWMKAYAYIPNILAGLTGFLVGVPFALVVLATLAGQREDNAASGRVQELSKIAWNQFRDAVHDLCGEQRVLAMTSIANQLLQHHDLVRAGFESYRTSEKTEDDYRGLQELAASQIKPWQEPFAQMMRAVGTSHDLQMSWYALLREWNTLDQYVRLQRLERGLPWFDRYQDSQLQQLMRPEAHPMQSFFRMHEGPKIEFSWQVETMWQAFNYLYDFANQNQAQYDISALVADKYFPSAPVQRYIESTEEAAENMRQLVRVIDAIGGSAWLS
ncbi:hypothetical protein [Mycobacteroides saopaulense]|uniref:Uncharacterized protein n=1 Tax=Mycobacteroides saopaulense TaxID=1578165 RepID=A0ABX3BX95_9MYCO|nr:hypothetical protein [Mycobacteroides saopaulense]OHT86540.1 hypothetical protein BKG68_10315 [Mycobacteroides saopaulense]OHU08399.1 hypothetical protein BKG73_15005 [Mycobacteroides saopaulense]